MPLLNFIPAPTWGDLIDILFLTLVTYQLYVWFKETRALRVIIGLVALGGIYSVAKSWDLFLTTWVFQILWQVLIILLLILFQSEIRQVLEKVSPLRYLRSRRRAIQKSFVNDLSRVAFDLAVENTGALIVLTRNDNPSEFIHGGQTIMALPDPTLIKSIFNRNSPTHDGAVVISRERITQMGSILPLSEKEDLPEQFGTRHRAALGLSEVSDAVCIVVSEERSEVSTVVEGQISSWQNPQELAEKLSEWIGGPEMRVPALNQFFKDMFVENWKTKLGALVLVTIAWLILAIQQEMKINITTPVRYSNLPVELAVDHASTSNVSVTLAGRRNRIGELKDQDIHVVVDLTEFAVGEHLIKISRKNLNIPRGINVDRITPQDIAVILKPLSADSVMQ
ncbi:MAG: diadenylate cyclase [Desulfobacterales bacterium]|nr:MAG: diadenylate cyclase [Desulfobacterales bacterium]